MNKAGVFQELSTAICRHLQPDQALHACLCQLQHYMPVDQMFLEVYEYELGAIRALAAATYEGGQAIDRLVPVNHMLDMGLETEVMVREASTADSAIVTVINDPETNPLAMTMIDSFGGSSDVSIMVINPVLDDKIMGSVVALAQGKHRYSQEHAEIYSLLETPYGISISNTMRHREVVRLKELLADDNQYLQRELLADVSSTIIGADFGLAGVMKAANKAANHDSPVLLLGETGVGKDVIANHIHRLSARTDAPFIRVNCGAIPESLMDSELFGHEKGAFTGATKQKRGRFERANTGTIFLDEIGELSLPAQVRLLRVLQNNEIERVGGTETLAIDVRVVAATHRDLDAMVANGEFRQDLLFRLNVLPITIPPLRARKHDIVALTEHIIDKKSHELKLGNSPKLTPQLIEQLCNYDWPGNVRELENVLERALILSEGDSLSLDNMLVSNQHITNTPAPLADEPPLVSLDEMTKRHIEIVLRHTKGRIHGVDGSAEILGINPSTLRSRMKKLGIKFGRDA